MKDLSKKVKYRIQFIQIGVRDEVKIKGDIGQCGCITYFKKFLKTFKSVTIDMVKDQDYF